jgi:type VI secretion system protein ImpH
MEDEKRPASYLLMQTLQDRPYDFDFFQAVRRIECVHQNLPRIGYSKRPQLDAVRFCQNVSLAFAPSAIEAFSEYTDEHPGRMFVNFFGLLGTNGPMPLSITEYIYDRLLNHGDKTLVSFLDVFHHRLISLFYRAWACNQQSVSYDRPQEDRFAVYIGSLFGIGEESLRNRDQVPDVAKLHYSGRLACQIKNAEGLKEILQDYFQISVDIQQFVGQWIHLPSENYCRLGESLENAKIGYTLVVGSRFWECQQKFRIKMGPMSFAEYQRMLPGGSSIRHLNAWVKNYVGDELNWELQLILRASDIPSICLGKIGQLGWSTWLGSNTFEEDADDLVLGTFVV